MEDLMALGTEITGKDRWKELSDEQRKGGKGTERNNRKGEWRDRWKERKNE